MRVTVGWRKFLTMTYWVLWLDNLLGRNQWEIVATFEGDTDALDLSDEQRRIIEESQKEKE